MGKKSKVQPKKLMCDKGHVLQIHAAHVTKVMKEILTKFSAAEEKALLSFEERLKEKKVTISRNLSVEDIKNYWGRYREIFGPEKDKLWDAVLMGLNKYHETLKERHRLCNETESLRKQNAELRHLLESHTPSVSCLDFFFFFSRARNVNNNNLDKYFSRKKDCLCCK